jgi:hypothetical protein
MNIDEGSASSNIRKAASAYMTVSQSSHGVNLWMIRDVRAAPTAIKEKSKEPCCRT